MLLVEHTMGTVNLKPKILIARRAFPRQISSVSELLNGMYAMCRRCRPFT